MGEMLFILLAKIGPWLLAISIPTKLLLKSPKKIFG